MLKPVYTKFSGRKEGAVFDLERYGGNNSDVEDSEWRVWGQSGVNYYCRDISIGEQTQRFGQVHLR